MLFFLVYSVLFLRIDAEPKIVTTWGEPVSFTYYSFITTDNYWNDCIRKCLDEDDCVLVFRLADKCQLFREGYISTVRLLDKSSGKVVGFKRDLNECPNSDSPPLFGEDTVSELTYSLTSMTSDSGEDLVGFQYKCATNSYISLQRSVPVCISIRVFPSPYIGKYSAAEALCTSENALSLTGPYDKIEEARAKRRWLDILALVSSSMPANVRSKISDLWMDGCCGTDGKNCTFADDTMNGTSEYSKLRTGFQSGEKCAFLPQSDTGVYLCGINAEPKIVTTWGEPVTYTYYSFITTDNYWNDCIRKCLEEDDCVLVFQLEDKCQLFREGYISTVRLLDKSSGKIVGFKRDLNECPNSDSPPLFGEDTVSEPTYSLTSITSEIGEDLVGFQYKCAINSYISLQRAKPVCISIRPFSAPYSGNYGVAEALCTSDDALSLTGPYDKIEEARARSFVVLNTNLAFSRVSGRWQDIGAFVNSSMPANVAGKISDLWMDGCCGTDGKNCTFADQTMNGTSQYNKFVQMYQGSEQCAFLSIKEAGMYSANKLKNSAWSQSSLFKGAKCRVQDPI
ncbi:unnamed protein product [Caenorhabditis brenneri]